MDEFQHIVYANLSVQFEAGSVKKVISYPKDILLSAKDILLSTIESEK